ncbi:MAG: polyprenyl synthetase family protein [Prevotellaceae bacterium]|jgi:geranylgeranyl diphosphate synthase type II|nr:polyprenyl synthetase family protein [Prevotellaceae bacterium]
MSNIFSSEDFHHLIENELAVLPYHKEPKGLYDPIAYMMGIRGKRVRPVVCLLSYNLFNDHIDDFVLKPAIGLELFHAFTLAHDDIMDGADIRRGKPALHAQWNTNTAILSGDAMCIGAYTFVSKCRPAILSSLLSLFSLTTAHVCEGQQLDMDYQLCETITHDQYLNMIALKTGALIACAAQIGALCGEASDSDLRLMYDFGLALGIGFQIRDDYLDAFGDPASFGKSIGGDILNNKKSWLLVNALSKAGESDKKELNRLLQLKNAPEEKIEGMIRMYRTLDVAQDAEAEVARYHIASSQALDKVDVSHRRKEQLFHYSASLLTREK